MLVQIVLFDGFGPMDVIGPYEVFSAGAMVTGGLLDVELVAAEGAREVPGGLGSLSLRATATLTPALADIVLLPGAAGDIPEDGAEPTADSVPAILGRSLETPLPGLLKQALDQPGLTVATVCGGSMILAMAGLLQGRYATTNHLGVDLLAATGACPIDARVVDDGDLVTGGGVTSGLDLGLYLLEREFGPQVALSVEKLFEFERRGTVWRNAGTTPIRQF
ncbi:DJ-1/PfpI family protein [Nocardia sp. NPDC050710]|uniref:DJ-1/PfpI family protein n=1 Tax=Nocardia sp. NPDC050710 TaxID=3157220 RepID=UPI0033FE5118